MQHSRVCWTDFFCKRTHISRRVFFRLYTYADCCCCCTFCILTKMIHFLEKPRSNQAVRIYICKRNAHNFQSVWCHLATISLMCHLKKNQIKPFCTTGRPLCCGCDACSYRCQENYHLSVLHSRSTHFYTHETYDLTVIAIVDNRWNWHAIEFLPFLKQLFKWGLHSWKDAKLQFTWG